MTTTHPLDPGPPPVALRKRMITCDAERVRDHVLATTGRDVEVDTTTPAPSMLLSREIWAWPGSRIPYHGNDVVAAAMSWESLHPVQIDSVLDLHATLHDRFVRRGREHVVTVVHAELAGTNTLAFRGTARVSAPVHGVSPPGYVRHIDDGRQQPPSLPPPSPATSTTILSQKVTPEMSAAYWRGWTSAEVESVWHTDSVAAQRDYGMPDVLVGGAQLASILGGAIDRLHARSGAQPPWRLTMTFIAPVFGGNTVHLSGDAPLHGLAPDQTPLGFRLHVGEGQDSQLAGAGEVSFLSRTAPAATRW